MTRNERAKAWRAAAGAALVIAAAATSGCQTSPKPTSGRPLIQAPVTCTDFTFPIYFEPRSAEITQEAEKLFGAAQARAHGCDVTGIVVVGLADIPGTVNANLELSKHRAGSVTSALQRHGFTNVEFRVKAAGDTGAVTTTGDAKPLRRRADVSIHLANRLGVPAH
jgi:outer membrane protein OmpA-like peptidoglycan-associated protein